MDWDSLTGVAGHMDVKYDGLDAERHLLDSQQYARSVEGSARLYKLVSHYCLYGEVLSGRKTSDIRCYSAPPQKGSFESTLVILTALTHQYPAFNDIYKKAFDWLVAKVMGHVKDALSGGSSVKELVEVVREQAKSSTELNTLLANGLIKANDNLAGLQEKMIQTIPALVEASKAPMRAALTPLGKSCDQIIQFSGSEHPIRIEEPEALAIRSDGDVVVGEAGDFIVTRIYSLSLDSGVCRISIDGFVGMYHGKINDVSLTVPNNQYTRAMDSHSQLKVRGKPVFKDGELHRLFITEA
ncbi:MULTISPECIES: hypothetical protein [Pseudomonas]|uniref:Uncharacterized protein n=1 Tax=Pseudomonas pudica TaxID=272772 RepID=A0ABS0G2L7_9PSED|nr:MULTISPECIES: hypothetical protein [Pseudomonas]MBF8646850.1 hypothetical protein [Pseudomonas pudica]MBF8760818.1 hypothetical protein [Pseudomonas pudica]